MLWVFLALAAASHASTASLHTSASPVAPARPTPRSEQPVPFKVGETLTFDVSWSSYLSAGTVTSTIQAKRPSYGSTAYYIVAEARPVTLLSRLYTLYYKMDTLLDSTTLLPQRGSVYSEEGSRHRFRETRFDRQARKAFFEMRTTTVMKTESGMSSYEQDALSALYVLRALPLKVGDHFTMPVSDGGMNYQVRIDVGPAERVKTAIGDLSALKLRPSIVDAHGAPVGRNMWLWISDDARHLPVKAQAELAVGSVNLVLSAAR